MHLVRLSTTLALLTTLAAPTFAVHAASPPAAPSPVGAKSLYQRLGGYDALAAVTDDFLGRLTTDSRLQRFFVGHSTDSLKSSTISLVHVLLFHVLEFPSAHRRPGYVAGNPRAGVRVCGIEPWHAY